MSYKSLFFISKIPGTKMFDLLKKELMSVCVKGGDDAFQFLVKKLIQMLTTYQFLNKAYIHQFSKLPVILPYCILFGPHSREVLGSPLLSDVDCHIRLFFF